MNYIQLLFCSDVSLQSFVYIFRRKMIENQCSQFTSQELNNNNKLNKNKNIECRK